jgi:acyl carrier protein
MDDILVQVRSVVAQFVDVDPQEITMEAHFRDDLGADSLDLVEMLMFLEEQFDVWISDEEAIQMTTVGQVVAYLSAHTGQDISWRRSTGMVQAKLSVPDEE